MIGKAIETVFTLIIILAIGYLMSYLQWYKKENKSFMSHLIINISIPCLIIKNLIIDYSREELISSVNLFILVLLAQAFGIILGFILSKALKLKGHRQSGFIGSSCLPNVIFIGLPVAVSLFGDQSIPYVMIYYLISNVILWTVFAPMFKEKDEKLSFKESVKEILSNLASIPLITMFSSIILLLLNFKVPNILVRPITLVSSMGTPLALIFIGGVLYEVGFKNIKIGKENIFVLIMRFIGYPVITYVMTRLAKLPALQTQVFTILAGMPVMTQLAVLSATYSDDSEFVLTNVVLTTILSLIFIPGATMILARLV